MPNEQAPAPPASELVAKVKERVERRFAQATGKASWHQWQLSHQMESNKDIEALIAALEEANRQHKADRDELAQALNERDLWKSNETLAQEKARASEERTRALLETLEEVRRFLSAALEQSP